MDDYFLKQLEDQHYKDMLNLKRELSIDKLIKTFPEAIQIIPEKLEEARKLLTTTAEYLLKAENEVQIKFPKYHEKEKREINLNFISNIICLDSEKEIKNFFRLQSEVEYLKFLNTPHSKYKNKKYFDLNEVKNKSFETLLNVLDINYRVFGKKIMINCVFHEDRNPSLSIDIEQNLFQCFGCLVGGTQIDFVMKYFNYDFKQSCEYLLKI